MATQHGDGLRINRIRGVGKLALCDCLATDPRDEWQRDDKKRRWPWRCDGVSSRRVCAKSACSGRVARAIRDRRRRSRIVLCGGGVKYISNAPAFRNNYYHYSYLVSTRWFSLGMTRMGCGDPPSPPPPRKIIVQHDCILLESRKQKKKKKTSRKKIISYVSKTRP